MKEGRVLALSGGVGGARLALGLSRVLEPDDLVIVANTGDDFRHLGLEISPDIDTLVYTLSGLANPELGWGRRDETWNCMAAIEQLGGETWFRLGDADLAMHLERTRRMAAGETLSEITEDLSKRLGVSTRIVPMSDDRVRTRVHTDTGWLAFQEYFVRRRCEPAVRALDYAGASSARPSPAFLDALQDVKLRAIVVCPSNPFLSIEPILAVSGVRKALAASVAPVVAVSPIIGGRAVKGPTAKMMQELGLEVSSSGIGNRYRDLIDVLVVDVEDAATTVAPEGVELVVEPTLMQSLQDRERLASVVLAMADRVASKSGRRTSM